MLIGDIIVRVRELIPDMPRVLAPLAGLAASTFGGPGTVPVGTYNVVLTATNKWGETLPTTPVIVAVGANGGISITGPATAALPPGATGVKAYFALAGQPFTQFASSPVVPFNIIAPGLPGTPPTRSTAFYPDSDGPRWSAYTIYRWLNDALVIASSVAGGIPDMSGVQAVAGTGIYALPGNWKKVWNMWFDGFPVAMAGQKDMFYRNQLQGISFLATLHKNTAQQVIELQPQPNQSGGSTTLSAGISATDTTIPLTATFSFYLQFGFAVVDQEIIEFSAINGANLTGCARGMGGTIATAHNSGAPVNELNIRFSGQRLFTNEYSVGQSQNGIDLPPDWILPLVDFMLCKSRQGEQSEAEYQSKLKQFTGFIKASLPANDQVTGPRQVGGTTNPSDSYPTSGGWGIIVP